MPTASRDEHALLEVQRPRRRARPRGVVRHHHDGLAVLAVERLQQVEDLVAGLAVEVARRLVAEQQRRVGDDGARDADALLLAARELPRVVPRGRPGRRPSARCHALPALGLRQLRQQQRQLDVPLGGQHRQQVVELEHEADVLRAPRESRPPDSRSMSVPPRRSSRDGGRARPSG
jgi:hypothetical protein